jgi:hypothetical protein
MHWGTQLNAIHGSALGCVCILSDEARFFLLNFMVCAMVETRRDCTSTAQTSTLDSLPLQLRFCNIY